MKQLFVILIALVFSVCVASAADVKIKLTMTTGPEDEPTTTFTPDTPKIYAMFQTKGISAGDKVRGVLIAEDVGDAAPPNTHVLEKTLSLDEDTNDGGFNFSKPTKGWPPGKYRMELYVNDELASTDKFTIKSGGNVQVKVTMTKAPEGEGTTTFDPDTPKVYAMFKTTGLKKGDKIRSVWIADDVGDAAPKGTKIDEKTLTAEGDTYHGVFSLSKPTKGWPVGEYRLEIYVGDELVTTKKFTVEGEAPTEESKDDQD